MITKPSAALQHNHAAEHNVSTSAKPVFQKNHALESERFSTDERNE